MPRFTLQVDLPTWIHAAVIGTSGKNIKRIMDITQTTIRFPEATQNSAVFISGAANFAKITHLYLHGLQSLLLSFDLTPTQVGSVALCRRTVPWPCLLTAAGTVAGRGAASDCNPGRRASRGDCAAGRGWSSRDYVVQSHRGRARVQRPHPHYRSDSRVSVQDPSRLARHAGVV